MDDPTYDRRTGLSEAEVLAGDIVRAEMADNWSLADLLRPRLRDANRSRRLIGLKPIRATQQWYFSEGSR